MARARPKTRHDVLIAGGGPVGLTLAIALAQKGYAAAVADPSAAAKVGADNRAFFIAYACWRIFEQLGVSGDLAPHAEPALSVSAEGAGGGISFLADDAHEGQPLGYVIESSRLNAVLAAAVKAAGVSLIAGRIDSASFEDPDAVASINGKEVRASLLVGCDGARSSVRQAAGLRFEGWDYPTKAVSATLRLATPHRGAARQIFLRGGPIAVIPLTGDRGSLVWTVDAAVADVLMAMTDAEFEAELQRQAGAFAAGAKLDGSRIAFPMGLRVAERFHAPRLALAGDSAHLVHPLAGQGLNLGLKDAAALVDVIVNAAYAGLDIGSEAALEPYTRWRRADTVATAAAMEGFARTFTGPAPVRAVAGLAMKLAGSSRDMRKFFAREAGGDLGDLPSLMQPAIRAEVPAA